MFYITLGFTLYFYVCFSFDFCVVCVFLRRRTINDDDEDDDKHMHAYTCMRRHYNIRMYAHTQSRMQVYMVLQKS